MKKRQREIKTMILLAAAIIFIVFGKCKAAVQSKEVISEKVKDDFAGKMLPEVEIEFLKKMEASSQIITEDIGKTEENRYYTNEKIQVNIEMNTVYLDNVKVCITAEDIDRRPITDGIPDMESIQKKLRESLENKNEEIEKGNRNSESNNEESDNEDDRGESNSGSENNSRASAVILLDRNANYRLTVIAVDKEDDESILEVYYFTIDNACPEIGRIMLKGSCYGIKNNENKKKGIIDLAEKDVKKSWNHFLETITYSVFSKEVAEIQLVGKDGISPVQIFYHVAGEDMSIEQLKEVDENEWTIYREGEVIPIGPNQKKRIYEKVVDYAGNTAYFSSDGILTDNRKPVIHVSCQDKASEQGFYRSDVTFIVSAEDKEESIGETSSGLMMVAYRVERNGIVTQSDIVYESDKKEEFVTKKEFSAVVKAENNNSNDIILYVTAVDRAGNKYIKKEKLAIDVTKPEISVLYDNDTGIDNRYYNGKRTATVMIKERNIDTKDIDISVKSEHGKKVFIGKWMYRPGNGKADEDMYICEVIFSKDDDYRFVVDCVDKAENRAREKFFDEFTVDTVAPVITVNYNGNVPEQGGCYNGDITATVTIREHNFDAKKVNIRTLTGESDGNTEVQTISGFHSEGDLHTAIIRYDKDGLYGLDVSYADQAGNQAIPFHGNTFTIDRTAPRLLISNVENQSANKGNVQPMVTCTDANYDGEQVFVSVKGANGGEIDLKEIGFKAVDIPNGQQFLMDFPKTEKMDDVYILTARMSDKAGNAKESSMQFSVNRYGSVYTLGTKTGEWIPNEECVYIKEGKNVVIIETNVNEVIERNISYTIGGMDAAVKEIREAGQCSEEEKAAGLYYQISEVDTKNTWYQYQYEINADNFVKEGRYTIQIDSVDKAGNHTSNISSRHKDSNFKVQFAIDRTAPSVVISGSKNGEIHNEEEHLLLLDVQDNLAIDYVTVYLNNQEYGSYREEDIAKMKGGFIPIVVKQSSEVQSIHVKAVDMAGNILSKETSGMYDKKFDDFNILVTQNLFVHILNTTWLLVVIFFGMVCGIGGMVILWKWIIRKGYRFFEKK